MVATVFIALSYKKAGDFISQKIDIRSLDLEAITKLVTDLSQPKFRALQLFKWLQSGVDDFD